MLETLTFYAATWKICQQIILFFVVNCWQPQEKDFLGKFITL